MLSAAREVLTKDGSAALSLRAVARQLGVAPNALYSHVEGTSDLVDAVLDDVLSAVAEPPPGQATARLTALLLDTYDVLVQHPGLVPLYLARQGVRGEQSMRLGEVMDGLLAHARVGPVAQARNVLLVHCIGSAAFAGGARSDSTPLSAAQTRDLYAQGVAWLLTGMAGAPTT